jgi:uracil-DNA glycosylase
MALNLIEPWQAVLKPEFEQPYMQQLRAFLVQERQSGKTLYPPTDLVFNAFNHCAPTDIKVVMLGQDPYHGPQQAHGLCFSVPAGVKTPPSLVNIYKELHTDMGMPIPAHGNLESWAAQGVFMLNSVLTVAAGQAASHQKQGWEQFTDKVIHLINERSEHVVFMLWGSYAQKKASFVDQQKHLVLKAPHPSPLSAHRGFLGCRHFSQANQWLQEKGLAPINWASVSG